MQWGSISSILMSGFFIVSCRDSDADSNRKPNIVFIMSDDHAAAAISSYGSTIVNTPNIDRIAQQGVRFTNAFVTSSLCSPARAAIITGQYGAKSGYKRIGDYFDGSKQTLPKLLQEGGYETAIFGKWHLFSQPTGFDHYEVVRGQGLYFDPSFYKTGMEWNEDWKSVRVNDRGEITPGYFTDIVTGKSIDWLENRKSNNSFALFVHHKAPHSPHVTHERYDHLFNEKIPVPETFDASFEGKNSYLKYDTAPDNKIQNAVPYALINSRDDMYKIYRGEYKPPVERGTRAYKEWGFQTLYQGYHRQIVSLDDNIGRLLDYLEEKGLDKNTIIVYASDNGWFLGDYGLYNKMLMYEESLKIPLVISYSDRFKGNRVEDHLVSILDFAPTFLDYAGVEIPDFMQGKSLRPILEGRNPREWRKSFFYHFYDQFNVPEHYGIRTHDHKLIKFLDPRGTEFELYDLKADPKETNNLFDDPKYRQIQETLMRELEELKREFES
jgi:arylsulfatase A-like enzyme